jgi:Holliday junction resolvase
VSNYTNGRALEYAVIADLENDGYRCTRAAGSKGVADIIALKPGEVLLVQVKRSNPQLPPRERVALWELSRYLRAVPIVACRIPRKPITYRELTGTGPGDWIEWVADRVEYHVNPNTRDEYR